MAHHAGRRLLPCAAVAGAALLLAARLGGDDPAPAPGATTVRLEGTVVHADPSWGLLFVQAASGTTFVDPIGLRALPAPGAHVLVEGEAGVAGGFAGILPTGVVETGRGPLPEPAVLASLEAARGRLAWVEVRGVVRSLEPAHGHSILDVQVGARRIEVQVLGELRAGPSDLLDAEILATGVLEPEEDGWHAPRLWVSSWEKVRVAERATPTAAIAPVSIGEAFELARVQHAHRVRVRGRLVDRPSAESLVLRDETGAIEVRGYERPGVTVGGVLDVAGFLETGPGGARLADVEEVRLDMPESLGRPAEGTASSPREPPITSLADVRALPVEEARRGRPVVVEAVVSAYDPFDSLLFLHEPSGAALVALFDASTEPFVDAVTGGRVPRAGQRVEVQARTAPGVLAPILVDARVRAVSRGAPLAFTPVSAARLATGQDDCRLVSVEGTVRRADARGRATALEFESEGQRFRAPLAETPAGGESERLVGARVRFRGVCATRYDWRQRFSHVELLLADLAAAEILSKPASLAPLRPIRDVLRPVPGQRAAPHVRVRGEVLMDGRRGMFLRDASGSLRVEPVSAMPLHPGDRVEAEGFAEPGRTGPRLADAEIRIVGRGPEPRPEPLTVGQVVGGSRSGELVRVAGRLIDGVRTGPGTVLLLESGEAVFEASFEDDGGRSLLPVPEPGSRVELTGVALTDAEDLRGPSLLLLLRAFGDVAVRQGPPWWTPLRARTIAGTLLATVAVALLWGIGLRRRVTRQTAQIRAQLTEMQRAQEAREELVADLEAKNTELERFTYSVSHDLRSPLVTVKGFLGFLERDAEAGNLARLREDTGRIGTAVDRMDALLRDVLELSRVGRIVNPSEAAPFAQVVKDAAELARGRLEARGVAVEVAPDLPVVFGDRARLVEVVQNLLDNAAKFAGDGAGPRVEVGHRGTDADGRAVLYVRDNGRGIEPRHHERVFGLFAKLDPATEGTGIGLALARRIVGVHGGRIWIESEGGGRGTTVCLTLPLPPAS